MRMARFLVIWLGVTALVSWGACSDDSGHGQQDAGIHDGQGFDAGDGSVKPDSDTDAGPTQLDCEGVEFAPCTPQEGSNGATLIMGTVITPDHILCNGQVLISRDSEHIVCVAEDCSGEDLAAQATVVCSDVVMPGMIDSHNHMTYNTLPLWRHPGKLYEHRDEWRRDPAFNAYDARLDNSEEPVADRYSEFRLMMAGTTAVHKSAGRTATYTGVRNLDRGAEGNGLGLPSDAIDECVFPLSSGCHQKPDYDNLNPNLRAYVIHLSEGINQKTYDEYDKAMTEGHIGSKTALIHGVTFDGPQLAELAGIGASLIWSPQTNIDLYGQTADAPAAWNMGLPVALAPDWTLSGCMNLLSELKCGQHVNEKYYNSMFTARDMVSMVTSRAARVLGIDELVGYLASGYFADVTLIKGDRVHPYNAVLDAQGAAVRGVFISGNLFYGDRDVFNSDIEYNAYCEDIDVCSVQKRICVKEDAGEPAQPLVVDDWAKFHYQDYVDYLQGKLDQLKAQKNPAPEDEYLFTLEPLFECTASYHCDLGNAYVPGEPTASDSDGDGVADSSDNCPEIFNPNQGDFDSDGTGDSCDSCPYAEDPNNCPKPNPDDRDGDGIINADDNCPAAANPDQADADNDDIGDVCDACPNYPNPNGQPCLATIYDIKTGQYDAGAMVMVSGVLVTGVSSDNKAFFVQVAADDTAYTGPDHSGIEVYIGSSGMQPTVGDKVSISGAVANFFGQVQISSISNITVESSGNAAPTPVDVTTTEAGTGGSRAEALEAVVVRVQNVQVTDIAPSLGPGDHDPNNEFVVDGKLRINDFMYLVSPFPSVGDTYTSLSGVLRLANNDSKLEPRSAADVQAGPPALDRFEPTMAFAYEGQTAVPLPNLEVRLTGPAQQNRVVTLSSSDTNVLTVPASVTITTGQQSAQVTVTGVAASAQAVTVTATLDSDHATASVRVLDGSEVPQVVSVDPSTQSIAVNGSGEVTATLDLPARTGGETLTVAASPGTFVTVPASVNVPAGQFSAVINLTTGATAGDEDVSVTLGTSAQHATVHVVDHSMTGLILAQVFYDANGTDDGLEWVQLYNGTGSAIDLSGYSIGWGGSNYAYGTVQLTGTVPAFSCFIVGGPTSSGDNGSPTFDQAVNFDPDIQNSGSTADGVALFDVIATAVTASTVPIDAVIYGGSNGNDLLDETGQAGAVDVGDAPSGSGLLRDSPTTWAATAIAPANCPAF